jgi:rubrerythrin
VFRRRRFRDVIERQLAFFEQDDAELLGDVDRALESYDRAERDEAEELYGDYQLAIEAATDRLAELRDTYARRLEENEAEQYEREFNATVVERWRDLALTIEES